MCSEAVPIPPAQKQAHRVDPQGAAPRHRTFAEVCRVYSTDALCSNSAPPARFFHGFHSSGFRWRTLGRPRAPAYRHSTRTCRRSPDDRRSRAGRGTWGSRIGNTWRFETYFEASSKEIPGASERFGDILGAFQSLYDAVQRCGERRNQKARCLVRWIHLIALRRERAGTPLERPRIP